MQRHPAATAGGSQQPGANYQTPSGGTTGTSSSSSNAAPAPAQKPIRRRMRMITSCLECRRRKLKCDKSQPCGHCLKNGRECLYLSPKLDEASQLRLTQFKDKVGSLERQLGRNAVSASKSQDAGGGGAAAPGVGRSGPLLADELVDDDEDGSTLEMTEMVNTDVAYDDDADGGADDLVDLGVMVGRMRITERIGGMARPRISEEVQVGIAGQPPQPPLSQPGPGVQGQPPPGHGGPPPPQAGAGANIEFWPGMPMESWPEFLRPGAGYIPPSSGLMMGQPSANPSLSLEHLLPTRGAADRLIHQYFEAVHPVARCVHFPSFQNDYNDFWYHVYENVEPRPSLQALVFAAMFSAAVSMDEMTSLKEFGRSQKSLYETLKLGVEMALSKANFLRTTRVQTMQAFVMYMIPLCRDEISRAHSVLVGAAVRMAECMGLHRDGQTYGLNPLDTHVRRLIWHQLCFLDIRTCEAQGPRPSIRRDDYDTKLPLNCEDQQLILAEGVPAPDSQQCWTSMTLPLIRFEINEMMRIIWVDRRKLETRRVTLTAVLSKIETFRKSMIKKYDALLNDNVPVQRYARLVMNLLLYRLHAMVLPMFHAQSSPGAQLPPRLNRVLVTAGIMIVEIGIQLETDPLYRPWMWYRGAYHQYQIAFLLAAELYGNPDNPDVDRVWGCLDHVFNTDRSMPRESKALQILGEVASKTAAYARLRKSRAPVQTSQVKLSWQGPKKPPYDGTSTTNTQPQHAMPNQQQQQQQQQQTFTSAPQQPQMNMQMPPQPSMAAAQPQQAPPLPGAVYAGISDGQTLWSPPMKHQGLDSSESGSSTNSVPGGLMDRAPHPLSRPPGNNSIEVDWDVINELFTNDPQTGDFTISGFADPMLGMNWQYWG